MSGKFFVVAAIAIGFVLDCEQAAAVDFSSSTHTGVMDKVYTGIIRAGHFSA